MATSPHYVFLTDTDITALIKAAVTEAVKDVQMHIKPEDKLLTQTQAAEFLGVSIPTLIKMKTKSLIPFTQIDNKIYFRKNEIMDALGALKRNGNRMHQPG